MLPRCVVFSSAFSHWTFGQHHPRQHHPRQHHHPRQVKLSPSEYAKSHLLNKDSRFCKCPQYVFWLLWQKEMREISAGVYNMLNSKRGQPTSVTILQNKVGTSDEQLEANFCTMLQSVRGIKQFLVYKVVYKVESTTLHDTRIGHTYTFSYI